MPRGITEIDVWKACDALLLEGARPTIERVRQKIGSGSPNTVSVHLETWFKHLGGRIKDPGAFAAPLDVPDPIQQAAKHFWELAQSESRKDLDDRLREAMAAAVANVEAEREKARTAESAAFESSARANRLELELATNVGALDAERRERVAVDTRLTLVNEQLVESRGRFEAAATELAQVRRDSQVEVSEAISRSVAAEKRAALDIDAERQARARADRRGESLERKIEGIQAELIAANDKAVRSTVTLGTQVDQLSRDAAELNDRLRLANKRTEELELIVQKEQQAAAESRGAAAAAQLVIRRLSDRGIRPKGKAAPGKSKIALVSGASEARAKQLAKLASQVETIIRESGEQTGFDAAEWVEDWVARPHPALGGKPPADYLDTAEGQAMVDRLIAQMQSGAYA